MPPHGVQSNDLVSYQRVFMDTRPEWCFLSSIVFNDTRVPRGSLSGKCTCTADTRRVEVFMVKWWLSLTCWLTDGVTFQQFFHCPEWNGQIERSAAVVALFSATCLANYESNRLNFKGGGLPPTVPLSYITVVEDLEWLYWFCQANVWGENRESQSLKAM